MIYIMGRSYLKLIKILKLSVKFEFYKINNISFYFHFPVQDCGHLL